MFQSESKRESLGKCNKFYKSRREGGTHASCPAISGMFLIFTLQTHFWCVPLFEKNSKIKNLLINEVGVLFEAGSYDHHSQSRSTTRAKFRGPHHRYCNHSSTLPPPRLRNRRSQHPHPRPPPPPTPHHPPLCTHMRALFH